MRLIGIEISNFRSIGEEPVTLSPLAKCNIIIGQNNAGKSNVLNAVHRILRMSKRQLEVLDGLDLPQTSSDSAFLYTMRFEGSPEEDAELISHNRTAIFEFVFSQITSEDRPRASNNSFARITNSNKAKAALDYLLGGEWSSLAEPPDFHIMFLSSGQSIFERHFSQSISNSYMIPDYRRIRANDNDIFSGGQLIKRLKDWQHPEPGHRELQDKFDAVERLMQRLLRLPEAKLEVTQSDKLLINNKYDNTRLPLENYGEGFSQLLIFVMALVSVEGGVFCIEEPEIHLYPRLQQELIKFMITETENQYFITTHSPSLVNAQSILPVEERENIQIFHLRLEDGVTQGGPVVDNKQIISVLSDLGVKASDLLQANCIIWVEGATDRIYLRKWLELIEPELVEGVHFSIMIYGGKDTLKHFSADSDNDSDERIDILRFNNHAIVVMDSDRMNADATIDADKLRICKEVSKEDGYCWITDGREIENYLPSSVIIAACNGPELNRGEVALSFGPYDKLDDVLKSALTSAGKKLFRYSKGKVDNARILAQYFEKNDISDELKGHLDQVIKLIKDWNG